MIRAYARIKGRKELAMYETGAQPAPDVLEQTERDVRWALRRQLTGPVLLVIQGGKGQRPAAPADEPEAA